MTFAPIVINAADRAANTTFKIGESPQANSAATIIVKNDMRTFTGREILIKGRILTIMMSNIFNFCSSYIYITTKTQRRLKVHEVYLFSFDTFVPSQ
jgi:hypothetical protein